MEPEETDLTVVDEVGTAFLDAGEGCADGGRYNQVAGVGVWESGFWGE